MQPDQPNEPIQPVGFWTFAGGDIPSWIEWQPTLLEGNRLMPEDFGKDMLMLGGTVIGFIAALLTLMEKLLDVKNRLNR